MRTTSYRFIKLLTICLVMISADLPSIASTESPTFAKDVAPIIFNNCTECHRPDQVAPFKLLSYRDAKKRGKTIAEVVGERFMPPWKADPGFGKFHNERRLTDKEIHTIQKWVAAGMPEGDATETPKIPKFPAEWSLGKPDHLFRPAKTYTLGPEGSDEYRCFVIPTGFDKDVFVKAVEVKPGNRSIVHHVIAYVDPQREGRKRDAETPEPGYVSFGGPGVRRAEWLDAWVPGMTPRRLPKGVGKHIPAGADLILQVHYHRSGKPEDDLTQFGIYLADETTTHKARVRDISDNKLDIPPGVKSHPAGKQYTLPTAITIYDVMPHMHLIGKTMTADAALPNGKKIPIIRISDWDFNWQLPYVYKTPLRLPKGTVIRMNATFDNSASNPNNPSNPPVRVRHGEETTDEMCMLFFTYIVDKERIENAGRTDKLINAAKGLRALANVTGRLKQRFDTDKDGKLSSSEQKQARAYLEQMRSAKNR